MLNRLYAESWNVAFRNKTTGEILDDKSTPFIIIKNRLRSWAADPFVVEVDGKPYIFAELYDYFLRRGVLGYCTIENGKATKWKTVIKEPYHLSFPSILAKEGSICIMPESSEGDILSVYRGTEFPDKWEKAQTIRRNVQFADTIPLPAPWTNFAVTHRIDDAENPELVLIDFDGQKNDASIPHENPFRSRPAGHFFNKGGKLIRPAQYSENSGDGYGKSLIFYECHFDGVQFTEMEWKEVRPEELTYDRKIRLDGMHTYNSSEHYEVIDLKTRRFNLFNLVMRVIGKFL